MTGEVLYVMWCKYIMNQPSWTYLGTERQHAWNKLAEWLMETGG